VTGRDRIVAVVVGVLAAIIASWLLVISPKRDEASRLQTQIHGLQSSLSSAQSQVAAGEGARNAFHSSYAAMVKLGEAVPTDDNVPSLIYQIQSAANKAGVDFRGLTLNPAGPGGAAAPAPVPATGTTGATGPTGATGATGVAASSTAVLPPGAAVGPAGFPVEPFTFTFQGNFFHLAGFFGRLQRFVVANNQRVSVSGRLLSLDAISLSPGPAGFPQIAATVSATTYLLPTNEGLLAGATPSGPAAATAQPVSSSGSSSSSPSSTPPAAVVGPVGAR
jgi:type II secretory pathway pseudopilin PulG